MIEDQTGHKFFGKSCLNPMTGPLWKLLSWMLQGWRNSCSVMSINESDARR